MGMRKLIFKRASLYVLVIALLLMAGETAAQAKNKTVLYFFWGNGCPHCNKEKIFLNHLGQKYPELKISSYEVWYDLENAGLFAQLTKAYGKKIEGVPTVFIGDFEPVVGYLGDEVTGKLIEEKVVACIRKGCINPLDKLRKPGEEKREPPKAAETGGPQKERVPEILKSHERADEKVIPGHDRSTEEGNVKETITSGRRDVKPEEPETVKLPLLGEVDTSKASLPLLTLVIAGMDGFNPCAFFVLFLLLSILIYAHSRRIMLLVGGTFVFFSGLIYFFFMSAWLNVFLLFGELKLITAGAGAVALLIALINIKDFFFFKKGVSLMIPEKAKPKLFERSRELLKRSSLPSMMLGTVVLAIVANTYELLCTAGFPMVYTRALTLHHLPTYQYYLYLVFYNVIYVIPLAAIVLTVVVTLGAKKMTEGQGRVLKLVSGIMMFYLGLVLLIRPAFLNNILISAGLLAVSLVTAGIIIIATRQTGKSKDR